MIWRWRVVVAASTPEMKSGTFVVRGGGVPTYRNGYKPINHSLGSYHDCILAMLQSHGNHPSSLCFHHASYIHQATTCMEEPVSLLFPSLLLSHLCISVFFTRSVY